MNPYKKLISNSFIFAIGDLGSRVITFLLLPLYTYYLTTGQYGISDIVLTTVNLLLPVIFLSVQSSVLRFVMDKNENIKVTMTNTFIIALFGFIIITFFYPFLSYLDILGENLIYMYIILVIMFLENYSSQYTRATGKLRIFAIKGILLSGVLGMSNVYFLVKLELGLKGYFLAYIFSHAVSVLFLFCTTDIVKQISWKYLNLSKIKELLKYSIPMIPNSIMWWLVSASSRYIINFFIGLSANGLFGIASRIPAILTIFNQVFTQAWQISAIEESKNENKEVFYSSVFNYISGVSFLSASFFILFLKVVFKFLFAQDFYLAWEVTPFIILGTVYSNLSSFLGTTYIVEKETKGVFKTSVIGGGSSLLLNLILIPKIGLIGAGIGSFISFFLMFIVRYFDTKKYVKVYINWRKIIIINTVIFIQIMILYSEFNYFLEMCFNSLLFIILVLINKDIFKPLLLLVKRIKKRR